MLREQPFMRDDTFLGVFHSIAEDFHIPANLLRIAVAPALVWSPFTTFAYYFAAGVLIFVIRWIFPNPSPVEQSLPDGVVGETEALAAADEEFVPMAEAA